jgi:hypothetical protein
MVQLLANSQSACAEDGLLVSLLRAHLAAGTGMPLAIQTVAANALGDLCCMLPPAHVDAAARVGAVQPSASSTELLKLNMVDLLVDRLSWARLQAEEAGHVEGSDALFEVQSSFYCCRRRCISRCARICSGCLPASLLMCLNC